MLQDEGPGGTFGPIGNETRFQAHEARAAPETLSDVPVRSPGWWVGARSCCKEAVTGVCKSQLSRWLWDSGVKFPVPCRPAVGASCSLGWASLVVTGGAKTAREVPQRGRWV